MKHNNTVIFCVNNYKAMSFQNDIIVPIQTGCANNKKNLGFLRDDTGINISKKNRNYAELTGWYWVWKNFLINYEGKNIGFCHYRRFFDFLDAIQVPLNEDFIKEIDMSLLKENFNKMNNKDVIDNLLNEYDVVVPHKLHFKNTTYEQFATSHPVEDLDKCIKIIQKKYQEYTKYVDQFFKSNSGYYTLNFVMKKELFENMCKFVFDILFKLEKKCNWKKYKLYRDSRMPAYITERIFNIWLLYQINENRIKIKEVPSVVVSYVEKFTFVMPVYNGMPYIKEAVDSLINQDYKNWELYILESCSNDGTHEFLKTIKDPRIKILFSGHRLTIEENWKRILDVPMADYLCIFGQDDSYLPDYLTNIVQTIRTHPNCNIYRTNINLINEKSEIFHKSNIKEKITIYDYLEGRLNHTYTETAAGYCIKTSRYKEIGGIDCKYRLMHTDDKLVMEAIGKNNYMAVSPYHSANYRCHTGSESGSPNADAEIGGFNYWLKWIYDLNDEKLRKIVTKWLPYHLTQIERFFSKEVMEKHKEIYELYNIDENDFHHRWIMKRFGKIKQKRNIFKYIFSIDNEFDVKTKRKVIRILGLKISLKRKNI